MSKYYDISTLLSYNKILNFIIGQRGGGKTFGAKKWCINDFLKKENQFYEFSVNLEKYYLQLVEISVNKKENVFAIAQSDFSSSAWKILQEKLEDISAYTFYVDSEGALCVGEKDRYYQIHLEEKGDGFDGK